MEQEITIQIVYQNKDFIIVNKPAGILTHPVFREMMTKEKTLAGWFIKNFPQSKNVGDNPKLRPGIVHRLDKNTSGLLIIALNQKSFFYFKKLFQDRQIEKTYLALVEGEITKEGRINFPIGLKKGSLKRTIHLRKTKLIKEAITIYKPLETFQCFDNKRITLLKVNILTGRTHQIRVHLSSIHHPIIGDNIYGKKKCLELSRLFLHSFSLEFSFKGTRYKFESDLPTDLKEILTKLRTGNKI